VEPTALDTDERMGVPNEHQNAEHLLFACHLLDSASYVGDVGVYTSHGDCQGLDAFLNLLHSHVKLGDVLGVAVDIAHHHGDCPDYGGCLCY
jgi:hypothetical protein